MHDIHIKPATGKRGIYEAILPQIEALIADETNLIANLANITAVLKTAFGWLWVGFYLAEGEELVLGPFQGPVACTRIARGRGVCGQSWAQNCTITVADVNSHPDHIACSSLSQSEIVVPICTQSGQVAAVLDVDSEYLAHFDATDAEYLNRLAGIIGRKHFQVA